MATLFMSHSLIKSMFHQLFSICKLFNILSLQMSYEAQILQNNFLDQCKALLPPTWPSVLSHPHRYAMSSTAQNPDLRTFIPSLLPRISPELPTCFHHALPFKTSSSQKRVHCELSWTSHDWLYQTSRWSPFSLMH